MADPETRALYVRDHERRTEQVRNTLALIDGLARGVVPPTDLVEREIREALATLVVYRDAIQAGDFDAKAVA